MTDPVYTQISDLKEKQVFHDCLIVLFVSLFKVVLNGEELIV